MLTYPWFTHPWFVKTWNTFQSQIRSYGHKHVLMAMNIGHKYDIKDTTFWGLCARRISYVLHKFKADELAYIMKMFAYERNID